MSERTETKRFVVCDCCLRSIEREVFFSAEYGGVRILVFKGEYKFNTEKTYNAEDMDLCSHCAAKFRNLGPSTGAERADG